MTSKLGNMPINQKPMSQAETKTPSTNHPSGRGVNIWHQRHQQYPATLLFLHFKEGEPMKEASLESIRNLFSERYWFRNWPNPTVQAVAAGVYVVWQGDQLIYAGMSGRQIEKNLGKKKYGLVTRLDSHANGRLSGDQFNVYVANRLVIPGLVPSQLPRFANGSLTLDLLTR